MTPEFDKKIEEILPSLTPDQRKVAQQRMDVLIQHLKNLTPKQAAERARRLDRKTTRALEKARKERARARRKKEIMDSPMGDVIRNVTKDIPKHGPDKD